MNLQNRIDAFAQLGFQLPSLLSPELYAQVSAANKWFTKSEITRALTAWSGLLSKEKLTSWASRYAIPESAPVKNILVITAGNIPLVGFHDFLSTLIAGHRFIGRLSSRDSILLTNIAQELIKLEPDFASCILFNDNSEPPDAVIATGSNNSARYFQQQFGGVPHIIRRNRSSAAILDGSESPEELFGLAADLLAYYGLGCRSTAHIFLPKGYQPEQLISPIAAFSPIDHCPYYEDNLRYHRARLQMDSIPFIDARQVLLIEKEQLHSPIGIVHYSFYDHQEVLLNQLSHHSSDIQCLSGHPATGQPIQSLGFAQKPELWDYADGVDTLEFLIK